MILRTTILFSIVHLVFNQESPCENFFKYENTKPGQEDRWFGILTLLSKESLWGIWIQVTLDQPAELFGNWFGDVISNNNVDYTIKNSRYKLEADTPVEVRFFVKYNRDKNPPRIYQIRLNGKLICVNKKATTTTSTTTTTPPTTTTPETVVEVTTTGRNLPLRNGKVECGKVPMQAMGFLYGGHNTSEGQWPWHVALYDSSGIQIKYICGGSLISDRHVITAAHCVTEPRSSRQVDPDNLLLYLGKHNLLKFGEEVQDRNLNTITVHPDYDPSLFFNDIAILTLSTKAIWSNFVRPICLWSGSTELDQIKNTKGTVVGWGFYKNKQLSNTLLQLDMPVISTTKCLFSNRNFFSQIIYDKNYCAGFANGTSACNGDSGGGMVFLKSGTTKQNGVWELRGLVSVGAAQGDLCDPEQYVVFTDVSKFRDWIDKVLNRDLLG